MRRRPSRFGPAPPDETELLRAFFTGSPFIISGPPTWNALGPGATAMFAATLVYNTRRTGEFTFDGQRYLLRRVLFPENPAPEYFVVDLIGPIGSQNATRPAQSGHRLRCEPPAATLPACG